MPGRNSRGAGATCGRPVIAGRPFDASARRIPPAESSFFKPPGKRRGRIFRAGRPFDASSTQDTAGGVSFFNPPGKRRADFRAGRPFDASIAPDSAAECPFSIRRKRGRISQGRTSLRRIDRAGERRRNVLFQSAGKPGGSLRAGCPCDASSAGYRRRNVLFQSAGNTAGGSLRAGRPFDASIAPDTAGGLSLLKPPGSAAGYFQGRTPLRRIKPRRATAECLLRSAGTPRAEVFRAGRPFDASIAPDTAGGLSFFNPPGAPRADLQGRTPLRRINRARYRRRIVLFQSAGKPSRADLFRAGRPFDASSPPDTASRSVSSSHQESASGGCCPS